jgi:hypothetical protein
VTTLPCATSPERTAMFVGDGPKDDRESNWRYARQLCRSCPVLDQCRAMVLTDEKNGVPHIGVAGGLLPSERKGAFREPRRINAAECGTLSGVNRHKSNKERMCHPCREAHVRAERDRRERRREERMAS